MLKIKLSPFGKKGEHHYRIYVIEERSKLTGSAVAVLGHYHPHTKTLTIDREELAVWLKKGAQPTATVHKLLKTK